MLAESGAVEGVLCSLAGGLEALRSAGVAIERVLLVGGGSRSRAVQALAPALLGVPVRLPDVATEWVAVGAARQAAWAFSGTPEAPPWPPSTVELPAASAGGDGAAAREAYGALLADSLPWLRRPGLPG